MMNNTIQPLRTRLGRSWAITGVCLGICLVATLPQAQAESLFRAGISYQTMQAYTPRSLFSVPRPMNVGDVVTVSISETTNMNVQNTNAITRKRTLDETSSTVLNRVIGKLTGIKHFLPSIDGIDNEHKIDVTARGQKVSTFQDSITCQVVQVLPNGHLLIQGKKTFLASGEEQNLLVSGIVNPYFLNSKNTIPSQQVANLQMNVIGKGVITRQQGDGVIGKYFQFFN